MKLIILLLQTCFILVACNVNSQDVDFKKFSDKFVFTELPISIPGECGERSSNDPSNLTLNEFNTILKLQNTKWKYQQDYYYNSACKFEIGEKYLGFIYFRSYLPVDITNEVGECILAVFNDNGKLIDELSIQGNVGDNLSYKGKVKIDYTIEINYEELSLDETGNSIIRNRKKNYRINENGNIQKIK